MGINRYLPIIGRKDRAEVRRLADLIGSLKRPQTIETYTDGRGEICAPALHAPVYAFAVRATFLQ